MKKTSVMLGLALGLGVSSSVFADGWNYSAHGARKTSVTQGSSSGLSTDTSSQNSKMAMSQSKGKEVGKTVIVYSDRGGESRTTEVTLIR
jgi:hypothetical protein